MAKDEPQKRARHDRPDIRARLIEAATTEFASKGYLGASTRSIAAAADAHQPQVLYHFGSKEDLWKAVVDELFEDLATHMELDFSLPVEELMPNVIRRYVEYTASSPALSKIMMHEAATPPDLVAWLTERHTASLYQLTTDMWKELSATGRVAPIEPMLVHHMFIGAASLVFQNVGEAEILLGVDPRAPEVLDRLVDSLVTLFVPGLQKPAS